MMHFQQLHQIGRRSGLKPVVAEFQLVEGIKQAERVINANGVFNEMIAVIAYFQFVAYFFVSHFLFTRQFVQFFFQIMMYLSFAYTAYFNITFIHRQIFQIIQGTEHAHFAELGNSRQQRKLYAAVHAFQRTVKGLQRVAKRLLQFLVANSLQHRLVVFIDQYHHTVARLFISPADDALETQ